VKPLALGVAAIVAVAAVATSKRTFGYFRDLMMRKRDDERMLDEDIPRFVNEGGSPVGAGAE